MASNIYQDTGNPEFWELKSGIQLKESGNPPTIENRSPKSTDILAWNPELQNPRLFGSPYIGRDIWFKETVT